jgi:hypothetical protein
MASRPRMRSHQNYGYNPWETKVDNLVRCSVCGFAGIDTETTQEPEQAVFSQTTTGTVYEIPTGTPVEGLSVRDKDVFTELGANSGCPFCGSPNWAFGTAPDLLW